MLLRSCMSWTFVALLAVLFATGTAHAAARHVVGSDGDIYLGGRFFELVLDR